MWAVESLQDMTFLKLNLPESITVEQVSEEIRAFKEELNHYLYEYEKLNKKI